MRRSKSEVYLHLVWATHNRHPWLTSELTPPVYGCIAHVAQRLGCLVLAVGGMPDHVHLAVKLPSRTSIALLAQQVKGASSKLAGDLSGREWPFRWQEGYGVFSRQPPACAKSGCLHRKAGPSSCRWQSLACFRGNRRSFSRARLFCADHSSVQRTALTEREGFIPSPSFPRINL